ncbi:MAG TPA: carboxypeptidase-like regulatory domain-containing protein, partial [Vicinamibacterales bacterium]|nr:carboxypeptidase-like regulatory domain-containing protein [Vicinamibacterales bacterium]
MEVKSMSVRPRSWLLLLLLSLVALPAFAQQTGSITGKVTDSSGGVLPGVTVEARSNVLPGPRVATTDADGVFQ